MRMSRMLRAVAQRARSVREPTSATVELEDDDPPDEIRDVVEALRQLFSTVRAESERNRIFYASMAHELRSPIQNLVGETEVALFKTRESADYRRVLESNLDELRDLGDAIDNLVTICSERRPVDGNSDLEDFDLLDEARIRLGRERSQAERRGVELAVEGQGDLSVRGDREGLLRAVRNLAANAIQWSPAGSTVEVRLVGLDDAIEVTVDDAGPGVPLELREEIFRPFVRGPSLNGQRIGYGLGLAIVRSAVDSQGGTIEVGSAPQGGARFHVVLPRSARPHE
jgi:signal transduction histidine kinase